MLVVWGWVAVRRWLVRTHPLKFSSIPKKLLASAFYLIATPSLLHSGFCDTHTHAHPFSILLLSKAFCTDALYLSPTTHSCPYSRLSRLSISSIAFQSPSTSHRMTSTPLPTFSVSKLHPARAQSLFKTVFRLFNN